jgi:hypothetical protein
MHGLLDRDKNVPTEPAWKSRVLQTSSFPFVGTHREYRYFGSSSLRVAVPTGRSGQRAIEESEVSARFIDFELRSGLQYLTCRPMLKPPIRTVVPTYSIIVVHGLESVDCIIRDFCLLFITFHNSTK